MAIKIGNSKTTEEVRAEKIAQINDPTALKMQLVKNATEIMSLQKELRLKQEEVSKLKNDIEIMKADKKALIIDYDNKIENIRRTKSLIGSDEEKKKIVLMLRAKNYSIEKINDYMENNAIDGVTMTDVKYIVKNLNNLEPSLIQYYQEQQKAFQATCKISSDNIKSIILEQTLQNIDEIEELIKNADKKNSIEVKSLLDSKNKYVSELNKLVGSLIDEEKEEKVVNIEIQNMQEELKNKSEKIIRFGMGNTKVV